MTEPWHIEAVWWKPDKPDSKISGTLIFEPGNWIRLELMGVLQQPSISEDEPTRLSTIYGAHIDGTPFTLDNCACVGFNLGGGPFAKSTYMAERALLGIHIETTNTLPFSHVSVGFPHLEEWMQIAPISFQIPNAQTTEGLITKAELKYPPSVSFSIPSDACRLEYNYAFTQSGDGRTGFEWTFSSSFKFVPNEPQPIDWYMNKIGQIQPLISILVGAHLINQSM